MKAMRFVRQFARDNPILVAIYGAVTCYALVYLSIRTTLPQERSPQEVQGGWSVRATRTHTEPAAEVVDMIQTIVATHRNISSTTHAKNSLSNFTSTDQIVSPSVLRDINEHLSDYSYEIALPVLDNYLNPCWKEALSDTTNLYNHNPFIMRQQDGATITKVLRSLAMHTYEPRLKKGEHWRLRCLPYFYIIGMAKCGTTDLWDLITKHPQVFPGLKKEYHWWSRARIDSNTPIDDYIPMFDIAAEKIRTVCPKTSTEGPTENYCVTGESTVSTFWHCKKFDTNADGLRVPPEPAQMTPGLLHRLQPNAKLILILRDPITRLYSDYVFFSTSKSSLSAKDFHKRCQTAIEMMQSCIQKHNLRICVHSADLHTELPIEIFKSIYVVFLQDWLAVFPRQQLLILHMETYSKNRVGTMDAVFDFLELDPMDSDLRNKILSKPIANSVNNYYSSHTGPMLQETIAMLRHFFEPFNKQLAQLIGDERYKWAY